MSKIIAHITKYDGKEKYKIAVEVDGNENGKIKSVKMRSEDGKASREKLEVFKMDFVTEVSSPVFDRYMHMETGEKTMASACSVCNNWMSYRDGDTINVDGDIEFPEYDYDPNVVY